MAIGRIILIFRWAAKALGRSNVSLFFAFSVYDLIPCLQYPVSSRRFLGRLDPIRTCFFGLP